LSHPLATTLISYAHLNRVKPSKDDNDFEVIVGEGVSAVVDDYNVQIGNVQMAARLGWDSRMLIIEGDKKPMMYHECTIQDSSLCIC
jgi:cation transport ATPase